MINRTKLIIYIRTLTNEEWVKASISPTDEDYLFTIIDDHRKMVSVVDILKENGIIDIRSMERKKLSQRTIYVKLQDVESSYLSKTRNDKINKILDI